MNIYTIHRFEAPDWDEWGAAVVRAESETGALALHPGGDPYSDSDPPDYWLIGNLHIELVASDVSGPAEVLVASFNAG